MATSRETILAALHARLLALPATALRGEVLPERVSAGGLLVLRDGERGEPEVTLSPLRYHYQHRAEIEAVVQGAERDSAFDTLCASIPAASADRDLGAAGRAGEFRLAGRALQRDLPHVHRNSRKRCGDVLILTLDLTNEPRWHDLVPGVRVQLCPLTTALMVATRSDRAVEAVPEDASDEERAVAFAKALARRAVLAWEGVGGADGKPIDPSPDAIDALLDVWPIFEAFQLTYVSKGLLLEQEKNVSALSPSGPSAGATDSARVANPASPAKRRAKTARRG